MNNEENPDVTLSVVIERDQFDWLKAKAKNEERSVSAVVRQILRIARTTAGPMPPQLNVKPGQDY